MVFKRLFAITLIVSAGSQLFAQQELGAFTSTGRAGVSTTFVTDYQSVGINPANLGWTPFYEGKKLTIGSLEFAASLHSEALSKPELRATFVKGTKTKLTRDEKLQAAKDFADAPLALNLDVNTFAAALQLENVGGFGLVVRERLQWYSSFNQNASDIIFLGYNAPYFDVKLDTAGVDVTDSSNVADLVAKGVSSAPKMYSELFDGSRITATWLREFAFSYGTSLVKNDDIALYAGGGVKYILGTGIIDIKIEDGKFEAFSSLSPSFNIDYGTAALSNPSALPPDSTSLIPKVVGQGWGFDIGGSLIIKERLKLGFAITDIGSVTWTGDVYTALDDTVITSRNDGWDTYNVIDESTNMFGDGTFEWGGEVERKVKLPTVMRVGASMVFADPIEVGFDMIVPFNDFTGNYQKAIFAVGADIKPAKWLILSTGFTTGGNYGFNLPVGLRIAVPSGNWEFGIASRDAVTFFSKNDPTISLATGLLRFRY